MSQLPRKKLTSFTTLNFRQLSLSDDATNGPSIGVGNGHLLDAKFSSENFFAGLRIEPPDFMSRDILWMELHVEEEAFLTTDVSLRGCTMDLQLASAQLVEGRKEDSS